MCPVNALPVAVGGVVQEGCQCGVGYVALDVAYVVTIDFEQSQAPPSMDQLLFMDLATNPDVKALARGDAYAHSAAAFVCGVCPVGGNCLEPGRTITSLLPKPGYSAGVPADEGSREWGHVKFYECGAACTPAVASDNSTSTLSGCLEGNTGALCGACEGGFAKGDDNVCYRCEESVVLSGLKMVAIFILFTAYLVGLPFWNLSNSLSPLAFASVVIKILLNSFQLNSVVADTQMHKAEVDAAFHLTTLHSSYLRRRPLCLSYGRRPWTRSWPPRTRCACRAYRLSPGSDHSRAQYTCFLRGGVFTSNHTRLGRSEPRASVACPWTVPSTT